MWRNHWMYNFYFMANLSDIYLCVWIISTRYSGQRRRLGILLFKFLGFCPVLRTIRVCWVKCFCTSHTNCFHCCFERKRKYLFVRSQRFSLFLSLYLLCITAIAADYSIHRSVCRLMDIIKRRVEWCDKAGQRLAMAGWLAGKKPKTKIVRTALPFLLLYKQHCIINDKIVCLWSVCVSIYIYVLYNNNNAYGSRVGTKIR